MKRTTFFVFLLLAVSVAFAVPAAAQDPGRQDPGGQDPNAPAHPWGFNIGVRAGNFELTEIDRTYDAIYGGDTFTLIGLDLELQIRKHFLVALAWESGSVDGQRVIPTTPPIQTGIKDELSLEPMHFTVGWLFRADKPLQIHVGAGLTFLSFDNKSLGRTESHSEQGNQFVVGARRSFNRFSVGVEVRQTSVPDAVGRDGLSAIFNEDDLGGFGTHIVLRYKVR